MTLFESQARYSLYNGERLAFSLRGTIGLLALCSSLLAVSLESPTEPKTS